jgi:hypothetical protein
MIRFDGPNLAQGCVSPGMPSVILPSGSYAIRFIEARRRSRAASEWLQINRVTHMDCGEP